MRACSGATWGMPAFTRLGNCLWPSLNMSHMSRGSEGASIGSIKGDSWELFPCFNCLHGEAGRICTAVGGTLPKRGRGVLSITGSSGFVSWWNLGGLLCAGQIWFSFKAERCEENTGDCSLYDCNSRELASKTWAALNPIRWPLPVSGIMGYALERELRIAFFKRFFKYIYNVTVAKTDAQRLTQKQSKYFCLVIQRQQKRLNLTCRRALWKWIFLLPSG